MGKQTHTKGRMKITAKKGKGITITMPEREVHTDNTKLTARQKHAQAMAGLKAKKVEQRGKTMRTGQIAGAATKAMTDNENAAAMAQLWNPAYAEGGSDDSKSEATTDTTDKGQQTGSGGPSWNGW